MKSFAHLLVGTLAFGAITFGAVSPLAYWPLALMSLGLGLWAIWRTRAWTDERLRRLGVALGVVAAAIMLQVVALPYSMLLRLSPGVDRFFRESQIVYQPPSVHSLSIAPQRTFEALVLFAALASLLVGLTAILKRLRLEWLINQVLGFGVALALLGVVQKAFMDPQVQAMYGLFPLEERGNPFGPFINRNHFAGWMVMILPLVVGYLFAVVAQARVPWHEGWSAVVRWMMTVDASRAIVIAFATLAMGMSLVLTGSRSGVAAFAVAMLVFGSLVAWSRYGRHLRRLVAVYLVVLLAGAVLWAGADDTVGRFVRSRSDAGGRLSAWQDTIRMSLDFPVFGVGVGSYRPAMIFYQTEGRDRMYFQAHNDYLQILAEGGVLLVIPSLVVLVLVVAGIHRRLTSGADDPMTFWIRAGAVAGLAGIAAQSFVEFSLQIPGNRVPFVILLAIALHRPPRMGMQTHERRRRA